MGTDDLFKKAKLAKEKREINKKRIVLDTILILCEGEKTEPNYFNGIRKDFHLSNIKVDGLGCNTFKIIEEGIKHRKDYSQVWCVFDRDSFTAQCFNKAFQMIKRYPNIHIAYSNESFELWYLLHFNYYDTAMSRKQYEKNLTELLGYKYRKNADNMYEILKENQPKAIRNAKKLLKTYPINNPEKNNPSTTVFKLVEELNKFQTL